MREERGLSCFTMPPRVFRKAKTICSIHQKSLKVRIFGLKLPSFLLPTPNHSYLFMAADQAVTFTQAGEAMLVAMRRVHLSFQVAKWDDFQLSAW